MTVEEEVRALRGTISVVAEREPCPERFTFYAIPGRGAVTLVDQETSREAEVPLFSYRAVRATLQALFGEAAVGDPP